MTKLSLTAQAVSNLVEVSEDQPVTTSVAIADALNRPHYGVIQLVRQHEESLNEFGLVKFEIAPRKSDTLNDTFEMCRGAIKPLAVAVLNEQQATLLISFMSNTPKVVDFKIRLVKAFYEMRQKLEQAKNDRMKITTYPEAFNMLREHAEEKWWQDFTRGMEKTTEHDHRLSNAAELVRRAYYDMNRLYDHLGEIEETTNKLKSLIVESDKIKVRLFDEIDNALHGLNYVNSIRDEMAIKAGRKDKK